MKVTAPKNRTFLAVCAAPLLLALAASASSSSDDYPAPSPSGDEYGDAVAPPTLYPNPTIGYKPTSEPADEEVASSGETSGTSMTGDGEGEDTSKGEEYEEEEGTSTGEEDEGSSMTTTGGEDEGTSMTTTGGDSSGGGATCNTYDEDVEAAMLLPETCEWNTYMCCWTGHDGSQEMTANSDVCRVLDYPNEGDDLEMPRDSEGSVYCHGFAWGDDDDVKSNILPLFHYVKNVGSTEDGGYYGNVEGAPECGCIEDMPVVDDAECSRFTNDGIVPCNNKLRGQYKGALGEPNGPMEANLVRECDNHDVPDYDYRSCAHNTYMCCWTENDGQGMADNTDVCRVGDTEYPGDSEGEVHCHGFVWPEDATDKYIHLLAQFVQHFDHRDRRGYYGNLPGAPMCGCIEEMPEVSEADCTQYDDEPGREGKFTACTKNDLRNSYEETYAMGELPNLVEECDNAEG